MVNEKVVVTTNTQDLLGLSAEAAEAILSNCQVQIALLNQASAGNTLPTDNTPKNGV